MKRRILFSLGALVFACTSVFAQTALKLPAIISDHMVLLSGVPAPIWGWAAPGGDVTVSFAGQTKTGKADENGKWIIRLDPLAADTKPQTLTVKSDTTIEVKDVLVGEVWLASGQSNMTLNVVQSAGGRKELTTADLPSLRLFTVDSEGSWKTEPDCTGAWVVCTPESAAPFSAAAFYFGRELYQALKVPVGMIHSSVKGSAIEAWTSLDAIKTVPGLEKIAKKFPAGGSTKAPRKTYPAVLFNGKIAPIIPYAIRGAIWYQGESNTDTARALLYKQQLATLISDWRTRWGSEFPFGFVQLPDFGGTGRNWPLVREAMLQSLSIPKTGMAIAMGLGEPKNLHPKRKKEVGQRLSLWALGTVYGLKLPSISGPLPGKHELKGSEFIVEFEHADNGLVGKDGPLKGFQLAGADKQWKPAQATIDGNRVIVTSTDIASPVALRYAWANGPDCNLFNGAGLPASPFRTDDWTDVNAVANTNAKVGAEAETEAETATR
jgi:hypothetical protein